MVSLGIVTSPLSVSFDSNTLKFIFTLLEADITVSLAMSIKAAGVFCKSVAVTAPPST